MRCTFCGTPIGEHMVHEQWGKQVTLHVECADIAMGVLV